MLKTVAAAIILYSPHLSSEGEQISALRAGAARSAEAITAPYVALIEARHTPIPSSPAQERRQARSSPETSAGALTF
jgi:hypothetical protein